MGWLFPLFTVKRIESFKKTWTVNKIHAYLYQLSHACTDQNISKKIRVLEKPVDNQRILFPTILQEFVKIKAFMDTFEELQGIKDFMISDRYKKFPLWSERSFFGRNADNLPTM